MYNLDDPNNENSFYMKLSLDALLVTINQSNKTCVNICFELFFEELQAAGSILRTTSYVHDVREGGHSVADLIRSIVTTVL